MKRHVGKKKPVPLAFKPDLDEAAKRWDAFYAGDMIDRPIVCVTAPKDGAKLVKGSDYYERAHGDLDDVIERGLAAGENTFYGGEAIPAFWLSFGPDEVAVFTGAELRWSDDSRDTNWSAPYVDDWSKALPLSLKADHPLWRRMLDFYRRAADRLAGKMLLTPPRPPHQHGPPRRHQRPPAAVHGPHRAA